MRKNWFLTRDQEDAVKDTVVKLFISSWEFGRDCDCNCPDYANGFGMIAVLTQLDLIDSSEQTQWVNECKDRAEQLFKENGSRKMRHE